MNANCFEIGTIQAFLDGEMSHDELSRVSGHIATCDDCAVMLAEAEDESAVVFPALEREFNTLVPTQRLWSKINDSIAIERDNTPIMQKAWVFLRVALGNPSITVAASVLIVVGIVAAVWMNRTPVDNTVTNVKNPVTTVSTPAINIPNTGDTVATAKNTPPVKYEQAAYRADNRRVVATPAIYKTNVSASPDGYLPGEESYVKTISILSKTVDTQKETTMRPSERIAYERDMAVVNDAIVKIKTAVKKNPKNESAKQMLYSSYQNKIDLLNSVSQKEELMASLK